MGGERVSSLRDSLAPAAGAYITGGRGQEEGGGVQRGEQGFLAVRVVRMVCSSVGGGGGQLSVQN